MLEQGTPDAFPQALWLLRAAAGNFRGHAPAPVSWKTLLAAFHGASLFYFGFVFTVKEGQEFGARSEPAGRANDPGASPGPGGDRQGE